MWVGVERRHTRERRVRAPAQRYAIFAEDERGPADDDIADGETAREIDRSGW